MSWDIASFGDFVAPYLGAGAWLIVGGYLIGAVASRLRVDRVAGRWLTAQMGLVERALFAYAAASSSPELVAGWLVMKIGGSWKGWPGEPGVFNGFLMGTGLSLAVGSTAGLLPAAIARGDSNAVAGPLLGPLLLLAGVYLTARVRRPSATSSTPAGVRKPSSQSAPAVAAGLASRT